MATLPVPAKMFFDDFSFDILDYTIKDGNTIIGTYRGLSNADEFGDYICFLQSDSPNISEGNIICTGSTHESFIVIKIAYDFYDGKPELVKAYYDDKNKPTRQSSSTTVFNIGSATGSVIGTQSVVNMHYQNSLQQLKEKVENDTSTDKEELKNLVSTLEMIVNEKTPAHKGILSRFSDVMERNSWISSSAASTILSWLAEKIL